MSGLLGLEWSAVFGIALYASVLALGAWLLIDGDPK